jgi:toxin ParE1/3/4
VKIGWSELAVAHLRSAYEYIATDNPTAAEGMLDRIFSAVEALERHPLMGRAGRVEETRELIVPGTPFIVAYRQTKSGIEVLAVMHAARKWPQEF